MPLWFVVASAAAGVALVLVGVYALSPPVALIVAGVGLLTAAFSVPVRPRDGDREV